MAAVLARAHAVAGEDAVLERDEIIEIGAACATDADGLS